MEDLTEIENAHIIDLYKFFLEKPYSSKNLDTQDEKIVDRCIALFELDYKCEILENLFPYENHPNDNDLCYSYPSRIPIPISEKISTGKEGQMENTEANVIESLLYQKIRKSMATENKLPKSKLKQPDETKLFYYPFIKTNYASERQGYRNNEMYSFREYLKYASAARVWYRLPIPTIFCKGKYICRSAGLAVEIDAKGKQIFHGHKTPETSDPSTWLKGITKICRFYDSKVLELLGVSSIMDLMVEFTKYKVHVIPVSECEKADTQKNYENFNLFALPYPGCEYFTELNETNCFCIDKMCRYDWSASKNEAPVVIPENNLSSTITKEWKHYAKWDISTMTEHYLRLIQKYILDPTSKETGLLVHCVSGWDRTPLFISLLRLSLWADGFIHVNLSAKQIFYLTIAYDWYLFGHELKDRLEKRELIMYFCFKYLEKISNHDFIPNGRTRHPSNDGFEFDSDMGSPLSSNGSIPHTKFAPAKTSVFFPEFNVADYTLPSDSTSVSDFVPASDSASTFDLVPASDSALSSKWPYKKGGFTFDGITDKKASSENMAPSGESYSELELETDFKSSIPERSPLRERNKGSPKFAPSPSGPKSGNLKGLRDLTGGKRSRKNSVVESPNLKKAENDISELHEEQENIEWESRADHESRADYISQKKASTPVPVPGGRPRNDSFSSIGSWCMVSPNSVLNDTAQKMFGESVFTKKTRTMSNSITEENAISRSSSQSSIKVIDREGNLALLKREFIKLFHHNEKMPSSMPPTTAKSFLNFFG